MLDQYDAKHAIGSQRDQEQVPDMDQKADRVQEDEERNQPTENPVETRRGARIHQSRASPSGLITVASGRLPGASFRARPAPEQPEDECKHDTEDRPSRNRQQKRRNAWPADVEQQIQHEEEGPGGKAGDGSEGSQAQDESPLAQRLPRVQAAQRSDQTASSFPFGSVK